MQIPSGAASSAVCSEMRLDFIAEFGKVFVVELVCLRACVGEGFDATPASGRDCLAEFITSRVCSVLSA